MKYYVGCNSWNNPSWIKTFYPKDLDTKYFLSYYSKHFNFVNLNFVFGSNIPKNTILKHWNKETPDEFRFSVKLPQAITDAALDNRVNVLSRSLEELAELEEKILAVIIAPPKNLSFSNDGRNWLEYILETCTYHGFSVAFDFSNHLTWHQDLIYNILRRYKSAFIWYESKFKFYYPAVTSNFIFLDLSNNNLNDKIQIKWIDLIKKKGEDNSHSYGNSIVDFSIIVLNDPIIAKSFKMNMNTGSNISLKNDTYNQTKKQQTMLVWAGRVIMHIDMNAFFPACEELRNPSLKGKAHAVIMTPEKGMITRGAVASCSYRAREYGVRSAISLQKAKQLCPELILNPVDKTYYSQISQQVMRILEEYADVLEQSSIDEAYLDCTQKILDYQKRSSRLQEMDKPAMKKENNQCDDESLRASVEKEYALKIKNSIKMQCGGLECSIGVAPNKSIAKIASGFEKPNGLTIVYPQDIKTFLSKLSVDKISGIGKITSKMLKEIGIESIEQLSNTNIQKLIEIFGKKQGLWMWNVANGRDNASVVARGDNLSISTEETLLSPTSDKQKIFELLAGNMVDDIYERTRRKGYEFKRVGIKLVRNNFSIETRETTFPSYQKKKESIVTVIESLLDKFNFDNDVYNDETIDKKNSKLVRKVGIKISGLSKIDRAIRDQRSLLDYI